ncbi:hypothetical protein HCU74_04120 [Spongiibacter sp. KMU-166]|uniref:Uracil DNA glycosylase superfamily protein n=1 Tax=Spongiibacter thalassae TaxID=2721624 RepID=A0ABX1GCB0_9GAMM|nr:hypothetical protein [Spongiibacter thalassae]NKI16605.1 hypothetical protein [Spongiibacter thalassae]
MRNKLESLLNELHAAHQKSDIAVACEKNGRSWGYSLITTSLKPDKPMLIGFNWGAATGENYDNQTSIESEALLDQDLGSFKRIVPYTEKFLGYGTMVDASQTNYCFFRSHSEREISQTDINLCKPIFRDLLSVVKPSMILCFSSKLRDHLIEDRQVFDLKTKVITFKRGATDIKYVVKKGALDGDIKVYFLPHPNYPMRKTAREQAWAFCFD